MVRPRKTTSRSVNLVVPRKSATRSLPAAAIPPEAVPSKLAARPDDSPSPSKRFRTPNRCTMSYLYYDERRGRQNVGCVVPRLRLGGRWLEQFGFSVGDELQVTAGQGFLLISHRQGKG